MKEKDQIRIVGKQLFSDNPDMIRITLDIPRIKWLILQSELKSKSFGNIVDAPQLIDTTSSIDTYA